MLTLGWSFYILDWILRLVMIPVVAHRRKRPWEAIAWLGFIFFLPVLGTLLYLWFGEISFRRGERKHERARRRIQELRPLEVQEPYVVRPLPEDSKRTLVQVTERLLTERLGGLPVVGRNAVELLEEETVIERLIADVDSARGHAHLLFYMYEADETGWRVARALARAAERGVRCRLLADAWAARPMFRKIKPWLVERGVEVHGLLKLNPISQPLTRLDMRNHRKLAVIDGTLAYTGSTNIHDPGSGLEEGVWHQITARLQGPAALQLQLVFLEDWYMATGGLLEDPDLFHPPPVAGEVPVQTFPSGPAYPTDSLQHLFAEVLNEARERVVITTPYFVPDDGTLLALRLAALRGVQVELVVPEESDRSLADAAGRAFFERLLEVGISVYLHPSGILHAKTISVDDTLALIGTPNFDRRSLFLNYEVLLVIYDAGVARDLRERQTAYLQRSRAVDRAAWRSRPLLRKVMDDTASLLSPVL